MRKVLLAVVLLAVLATSASATVVVSGNVSSFPGSGSQGITVQLELRNCGNNRPRVLGVTDVVATIIPITPNTTTGLFSKTIYSNNQIDCGGTTPTQYAVTYYKSGAVMGSVKLYTFNSDTDLTSAAPVNPGVPPAGSTIIGCDTLPAFTGDVTKPQGSCGQTLASSPSLLTRFASVNVVSDCGAVGDNVTDDYAAIQACLNTYAGQHIIFPRRGAYITDGGTATNCSYYSSQQLVMKGNTQVLDGGVPANWAGGTCIRFPSGVGGISVPFDAYSVLIENLELRGGDCANSFDLTTFEDWRGTEALLRGVGPDGISIPGSVPRLQNLNIGCFKRHGIYISGDNTIHANSFPDFWRIDRVLTNANRGDGIFINGGDSNAGVATMVDSRSNMLFGVRDNAPLGNTFVGVGTHNNHHDAIFAGTTQALTSCAVAGNVITCTASAALANGVPTTNTWVTTAGQVDGTFNGTFRVTSFNAGAKTVTGTFTHADGSTTGGTIGTASSAQVYNAWSGAGIQGGCIGGTDGAATWIDPYIEGGQGIGGICERLAAGTTVIGSNSDPVTSGDTTAAQPMWIHGGKIYGSTTFNQPGDSTLAVNLIAGLTADQTEEIQFFDHLSNVKHQIKYTGGSLQFNDAGDGFVWMFKPDGGNINIRGGSATEDIHFNENIGRDVLFYCGGGAVCAKAASDSNFYVKSLLPLTAAGGDIGSGALPFFHVCIGTAATNNACITPAAMAAARAVSMADPLANAALRLEITGAATVDLANVATAACTADSADVTVTGARVGDQIDVTAGTALQAGGFLIGRVTANDTARFQFCNLSGGGIDRASDTYTLRVKK